MLKPIEPKRDKKKHNINLYRLTLRDLLRNLNISDKGLDSDLLDGGFKLSYDEPEFYWYTPETEEQFQKRYEKYLKDLEKYNNDPMVIKLKEYEIKSLRKKIQQLEDELGVEHG